MEIHTDPIPETAREFIDEYISRPYTLEIIGLCSVDYQGRAKSKLDRGERIVLVKQDNALLVHGPDNYQPKNWQPETDEFDVTVDDDQLVIESRRRNPEEVVTIRFDSLDLVFVTELVDKSDLKVRGHEVDIHEAIEQDPAIVEDGLTVIERERNTDAGFIDVFARDTEDNLVVIEVKRNPDHNSVLQLHRYIDEIEDEFPSKAIRGILVAPDVSSSVQSYLDDRDLEFVAVDMDDVIPSYEAFKESQADLNQFGSSYE